MARRGARLEPNTRIEDLRAALPEGYSVHTWSPGDGVTRYRFFKHAPPDQTYFGPANGLATALGLKEARTFARALTHEPNAKSKVSDKIDVNQIAELFGLPDWDSIYESNIDGVIGEAGSYAYKEAVNDGASEEEAEEADMKGQQEAESDLFGQWHGAVTGAAETLFEKHGLVLVPVKAKGGSKYPYEYRVVPEKSWDDAARGIIDTINGVGMFRFDTLREFLDSGPYTARTGVLTHLHHIASYPEVYGTTSARRLYENSFR